MADTIMKQLLSPNEIQRNSEKIKQRGGTLGRDEFTEQLFGIMIVLLLDPNGTFKLSCFHVVVSTNFPVLQNNGFRLQGKREISRDFRHGGLQNDWEFAGSFYRKTAALRLMLNNPALV